MIAALYEYKVTGAADVLKALKVTSPRGSNDPSTLTLFRRLIHLLIKRYLHGAGHPSSLRGTTVSEAEFDRVQNSHAFRPALLLLAATESEQPPGKRDWRLEVTKRFL